MMHCAQCCIVLCYNLGVVLYWTLLQLMWCMFPVAMCPYYSTWAALASYSGSLSIALFLLSASWIFQICSSRTVVLLLRIYGTLFLFCSFMEQFWPALRSYILFVFISFCSGRNSSLQWDPALETKVRLLLYPTLTFPQPDKSAAYSALEAGVGVSVILVRSVPVPVPEVFSHIRMQYVRSMPKPRKAISMWL